MLRARLDQARTTVERRLEPVTGSVFGTALRRTLDAGIVDSAASLTYYVILSLVPCFTLLLALVGLIGKDPETTNALLQVIEEGASADAAETIRSGLEQALSSVPRSGTALGVGAIGTIYVASLYVAAFSRAANALAGHSRRGALRKRPLQALATFGGILLLALTLLLVVISKRLADALAGVTGWGVFSTELFPLMKYSVILACLLAIVTGLYSLDPTKERRWLPTLGAVIAIGVWIGATLGFEVYLRTLGSYDKTYGAALGGSIAFLVWAWMSNLLLLFGMAIDQERRARRAGPG